MEAGCSLLCVFTSPDPFNEIFYISAFCLKIAIYCAQLILWYFCMSWLHLSTIQTNRERIQAKLNFQCLGGFFFFLPLLMLQTLLSTRLYHISSTCFLLFQSYRWLVLNYSCQSLVLIKYFLLFLNNKSTVEIYT